MLKVIRARGARSAPIKAHHHQRHQHQDKRGCLRTSGQPRRQAQQMSAGGTGKAAAAVVRSVVRARIVFDTSSKKFNDNTA
jgi:hypothetical protein